MKTCISIQILLEFVPRGPIDNKFILLQGMARLPELWAEIASH